MHFIPPFDFLLSKNTKVWIKRNKWLSLKVYLGNTLIILHIDKSSTVMR